MAQRNAWLTPNVGTGETISRCLTFPRSMLPHVTGALAALTEIWNWEQYGDMSPAAAAHLATVMLDQFVSECAANMLLRQNPTNPCQLERSDDNGETWVMFADTSLCMSGTPQPPETAEYPDDMRIDPITDKLQYSLDGGVTWYDYPTPTTTEPTQPYTPPRETPAGATDNERRCAAASSAAVALNQMYEQTYGAIAAGLANAWGTFSNFMNDLTDFVFGITYGRVWDIVKIIGLWEPIDFETNYAAPTLGNEAIDALTCLIYDNTTIDQNGHAQIDFGAVRDNVISALGINPGTAVWTHLNYLQAAGLERIADVGFGTTDCTCDPYDWFALGGHGKQDTYGMPYPQGSSSACQNIAAATYDSGLDAWIEAKCINGPDYHTNYEVWLPLYEVLHITQIRVLRSNTNPNYLQNRITAFNGAAVTFENSNSVQYAAGGVWATYNVDILADNIRFQARGLDPGGPYRQVRLLAVELTIEP